MSSPRSPRRLAPTLAVVAALAAAPTAAARPAAPVSFAPVLAARDTALALHGSGVLRWRSLLDVYAAALYLAPGTDPARVLDDVPKRLEIAYFFAFDPEDFARATDEMLPRNLSAAEIARLRPALDRLNALYRPVAPGDRYALTYVPGVGTELSLNGETLGTVPGAALARAVFGIWLGTRPKDDALKAKLLNLR